MLKITKVLLLGVAATLVGLTGLKAVGGEVFPNVDDIFSFAQFGPEKYQVGNDGNSRLIWDYLNPSPTAYLGSALWILNPQSQVVAAGDTQIPASVGRGINTVGNSNIAIHVQASGNTTLAFANVITPATSTSPPIVDSFATWTFNAQGKLIASGGWYGPFGQTAVANIAFNKDGILVVKWITVANGGTQFLWSAWTLDEFGRIQTAAGPFGPFGNFTALGTVGVSTVNGSPVQLWNWLIETTTPSQQFKLNTWTLDRTGNIIAANSFGPF